MKKIRVVLFGLCLYGCSKYNSGEDVIQDDFSFTLNDTTGVRADGVSSITLRFINTKKVRQGLHVLFESNKGSIVTADQLYSSNKAETRLLLAEDTGTYSIKATLKDGDAIVVQKIISASFRPLFQSQDFDIELPDSTLVRADATSSMAVRIKSAGVYKKDFVTHFEASKGTLLQPDVPFQNGVGRTTFTVGQDVGPYTLKVQLKDGSTVKMEKSVSFVIRSARAESIIMEMSSSTWNPAQQLTIKTLLTRASGKVSTGQAVSFLAFQLGNNPGDTVFVGRFEGLLNNVSNEQGLLGDVKLFLNAPGIDISKPVVVYAKTINDHGSIVGRTITLPYN